MNSISPKQFNDRFFIDSQSKKVSHGGHADVTTAFDNQLSRKVALKIIYGETAERRYPDLKTMAKLFQFEHGHLLRYFDFLHVEKTKTEPGFDVLVMDYISGGDFSYLKEANPSDKNNVKIVEGMLGAIGFLHQNNIYHGNLKPGNVLIQDIGHFHIRLADYGFIHQQKYDQTGSKYPLESLKYLAPEQISPEDFARRRKIRQNVDFWALGMLIYELFTGRYVFGEVKGNSSDLMTHILHADLPSDIDLLPPPYAELVQACLVRSAGKRPKSISTLRKILDGRIVWRNGKSKRRKPEQPAPIIPQVPQPISCSSCRKQNKPGATICNYCRNPLFGPAFLNNFSRSGTVGFWAVVFLSLLFVPLGFLYYDFYSNCDWVNGACDFRLYAENLAQGLQATENEGATIPIFGFMALDAVLAGIFFMVWFVRVSKNLTALGANDQRFAPWFLPACLVFAVGGVILTVTAHPIFIVLAIIALLLPLWIFQEVWKGSNENFLNAGNNWKQARSSFMIFSWWITTLLLPILVLLPFLPTSFEGKVYEGWFFATTCLAGGYWLMSVLLVFRINRRQISKFKSWTRQVDV